MDWIGNRFEHYVKNNPVLLATATPVYTAINRPRLTDFWDTDQISNDNPSPNFSLGLTEIINSNYLSDYTIPNNNPTPEHSFTYPRINREEMQICEGYVPGSTRRRKYVSRMAKGECPLLTEGREVDHFATASLLNRDTTIRNENISTLRLWLDENVHRTYAREILPMAVGYSAGLLEYFFRGKLHVSLLVPSVDEAIYNISDRNDTGRDIDRVAFFIRNNSRLNGAIEPVTNGNITLTVSYKNDQTGETIFVPAGTASISGIPEVGNENALIVLFTLSESIPTQIAKDITYSLVFRGQLGNERDAVIGKVITTPVLHSVTPDQGIERDVVTISGDNLPNIAPPYTTASEHIKFSHDWSMPYRVEVISKTETEITVRVPDTAGLMKPGYGGLRLRKVVREGGEEESIYSNPVPFYPIAQGIIRNSTEGWQNVTMSALAPISGDYNPLPPPVVYQVPPNGSVGIRLMTGFTYGALGGPGTQGTIENIWTLTPEAIDFEFDIFPSD